MASIRRDIALDVSADVAWDAVRDVGAVDKRLVPGIVTAARLEGDARIVTFANGAVVRELIVDVDDATRRVAYAAVGGRAAHHHAVMQVFADGPERSRLVWVTDVLPHDIAGPIGTMVEAGAVAIKRTLESGQPAPAGSALPVPAVGR